VTQAGYGPGAVGKFACGRGGQTFSAEGHIEKFIATKGSGVASPNILRRGKMFGFRRITLFCLEKRVSKHKMTIFSKNLGGMAPLALPGYAYDRGPHLFHLCTSVAIYVSKYELMIIYFNLKKH